MTAAPRAPYTWINHTSPDRRHPAARARRSPHAFRASSAAYFFSRAPTTPLCPSASVSPYLIVLLLFFVAGPLPEGRRRGARGRTSITVFRIASLRGRAARKRRAPPSDDNTRTDRTLARCPFGGARASSSPARARPPPHAHIFNYSRGLNPLPGGRYLCRNNTRGRSSQATVQPLTCVVLRAGRDEDISSHRPFLPPLCLFALPRAQVHAAAFVSWTLLT